MVIDHIGIVVKSLEAGIKHWEGVFNYKQKTAPVINTRQKVRVVFMAKTGSTMIKLVEPVDETSPVFSYAQKGGGLHHLCFKYKNMNTELTSLKNMGFRILKSPEPGEAFESENIAFVYVQHGLNIELIDTDKKAEIILLFQTNAQT